MIRQQVINDINIPFNDYSQAQKINAWVIQTRTGRDKPVEAPNLRATLEIANLPVYHFGCMCDLEMESMGGSFGSEFTMFYDIRKRYKETMMLNPRFLSKILYAWSKALGIRYIDRRTPNKRTGVKLWCTSYSKSTPLITGIDCIHMLEDIITMIKYNSKLRIKDRGISDVLLGLVDNSTISIDDMKKNLFHVIQVHDRVWTIPIYNLIYIVGIINELNSGKYIMNQKIPIVKKLWNVDEKKCTDYTAKRVKVKND